MKTQKSDVLEYIKANGKITRAEAWYDLGIAELPARICELQKDGFRFTKKTVPFKSRLGRMSSYTEYSLAEG